MTRPPRYIATFGENPIRMTPELRDFVERRVTPFMDSSGIARPLVHVLSEVYLQGIRDALQILKPEGENT